VTLQTDHHTYTRSHTVCKRYFDGVDDEETLNNKLVEINLAESKQPFHPYDHDDIKPLDNSENTLAEFLQPTTNGKCVNIRYELEIKWKMEGVCSVYDEPNWIINLFVQPPWLPNYSQMQAPPDWNPQIYDPYQMNVPTVINNPGYPDTHPDYNVVPQPGPAPYPGPAIVNDPNGIPQPPGPPYQPNVDPNHHPGGYKPEEVPSEHSSQSYKVIEKGEGEKYIELEEVLLEEK